MQGWQTGTQPQQRTLDRKQFASGWFLSLRRELSGRPALLALAGAIVGLTFPTHPLNLLFLVLGLFLAETLPSRVWLAVGFALGATLSPSVQLSPAGHTLAPTGAVHGVYAVRTIVGRSFVLAGPDGEIFVPTDSVEIKPGQRLLPGDEVSMEGEVSERGVATGRIVALPPSLFSQLRASLASNWESRLPLADAKRLESMALGLSEELAPGDREVVRESGTYSLISTSGLQVFAIAWTAIGFLSLLPLPRSIRLATAFAILLVYLAATGWHAGTWRAVGVCGLAWLAPYLRREFDGLSALGLVSLAYLVVRPAAVFEPGFQYATVAMAGWCFLPLGHRPATTREWLLANAWMWLILTPLTGAIFGEISLVSILTGPLILMVSPIVIIGSMLGTIIPFFGTFLLIGASLFAKLIFSVLEFFSRLPFASIIFPALSGYLLVAYYAVLLRLWRSKARPLGAV